MKEKKDIDKIFQEGFENLDLSPSPQVWEKIQTRLKGEQAGRKVVPLWIRMSGVAALIAVLLTVGNWAFDPLNTNVPAITKENVEQIEQETERTIDENQKIDETHIVSVESLEKDNALKENSVEDEVQKSKLPSAAKTSQFATSKSNKDDKIFKDDDQTEIVYSTKKDAAKVASEEKEIEIPVENNEEKVRQLLDKDQNAIAKEQKEDDGLEEGADDRPSLLDAIAEQENIKYSQETKSAPENRWSVTPNLAPVYYNGFGSGSSIDPDLDYNPQKGDINMSYGLQVSYALNDRLSVRTGLNNVDLSYSTSDIIIATGPVSRGLRGVNYGEQNIVVTAVSRNNMPDGMPSGELDGLNLKSSAGNARLIQNINYYEVPLELQYALVDKRFGVNLIGGISTLLLGDNEISVKSDNYSEVGS